MNKKRLGGMVVKMKKKELGLLPCVKDQKEIIRRNKMVSLRCMKQ